MAGFVYIMSHTAFPDRIKIGKSKKDPTVDRVNELNKTGVPESFHVEYYAFVPDETRLEKSVHDHFSNRRPNKKKEFFTVPVYEAVHQIREKAKQIGSIKFEEELFTSIGKKGSSKNEFRNNKNNNNFKSQKSGSYFADQFGTYHGETKGGLEHGFGTKNFKNGNVYVGDFIEGRFAGKGTLSLFNGQKYEGEFKDGMFNGMGRLNYPNGDKLVGVFKSGLCHGDGRLVYKNGNEFRGTFLKSKRHGFGVLTFRSGSKYHGE